MMLKLLSLNVLMFSACALSPRYVVPTPCLVSPAPVPPQVLGENGGNGKVCYSAKDDYANTVYLMQAERWKEEIRHCQVIEEKIDRF